MLVKYDIDFQDGREGWISIRLVYSGCNRAKNGNSCPGCHNEWLWDYSFGVCRRKFTEWLKGIAKTGWKPSGIIVTGGEPLDQDPEEIEGDVKLVQKAFDVQVPVFIYTGYEWEKAKTHPILRLASYVKVGPYRQDLPPGEFASSNQRVEKLS
jgi:organic radical activating enzyme